MAETTLSVHQNHAMGSYRLDLFRDGQQNLCISVQGSHGDESFQADFDDLSDSQIDEIIGFLELSKHGA